MKPSIEVQLACANAVLRWYGEGKHLRFRPGVIRGLMPDTDQFCSAYMLQEVETGSQARTILAANAADYDDDGRPCYPDAQVSASDYCDALREHFGTEPVVGQPIAAPETPASGPFKVQLCKHIGDNWRFGAPCPICPPPEVSIDRQLAAHVQTESAVEQISIAFRNAMPDIRFTPSEGFIGEDVWHPAPREPRWWMDAYEFLARVNPKRYRIWSESYMEGMYTHYQLLDNGMFSELGPKLFRSNITGQCGLA